MLVSRETLLKARERLVALRKYASEDDYLIVSGPQWAYGRSNDNSRLGFFLRPMDDPLLGVAVMPLRLARRIQEFMGGSLMSAAAYLDKAIERLDGCI